MTFAGDDDDDDTAVLCSRKGARANWVINCNPYLKEKNHDSKQASKWD